jgi:hypothetical protein
VSPPEQAAEVVAGREAGLETSTAAYEPQPPVLCRDEQPLQVLTETRAPRGATKKQGQRGASDYDRKGPASIFRFAAPRAGFRQAPARVRRTTADWALAGAQRLDTRSTACEEVTLVCDTLNTHTKGAG